MHVLGVLLLVSLASAGLAAAGPAPGPDDYAAWRPLLADELAGAAIDHPTDLYKFLIQGVLGPGHAVPDAARARARLASEWSATLDLAPAGRAPLLQPLRPDGRLVRVDLVRLRQLVAAEGPGGESAALDTLAAVFVRTAARWPRDPGRLAALWAAAVADTALWAGAFPAASLAELARQVRGTWPTLHHSPSYAARRAPHYRVVETALLPAEWRRAGGLP